MKNNKFNQDVEDYNEMKRDSLMVLIFNIVFVIIEIIAGIFANSLLIITDALRDLGDSFTLLISYILIKISSKESDNLYTYGYKRFTIIGALFNTIILFISSIVVLYASFYRFENPEVINVKISFFIAIVGIIISSEGVWRLRDNNHIISKSLMLHVLEDTLGWIAVLFSSILIYLYQIYIIDTIFSIIIALFILFQSIYYIKQILNVILQKVPNALDINELKMKILLNKNIKDVIDFKVWSLDGSIHVCTITIKISNDDVVSKTTLIKTQIKELLIQYNIEYITIEIQV